MSISPTAAPPSARKHPVLAELFRKAEGKHFTDEELASIDKLYPQLKQSIAAAKEVRSKDVAIIGRVVKEVFSQYPYEKFHDFANPKCIRDVRYVVIYAVQALLAQDPHWFEDKLLIWFKTILQAFDFPDRSVQSAGALFADPILEEKLKQLPKKTKSIFHCYYRLKQEMKKELKPEHFELLASYFDQATSTLSEKY